MQKITKTLDMQITLKKTHEHMVDVTRVQKKNEHELKKKLITLDIN